MKVSPKLSLIFNVGVLSLTVCFPVLNALIARSLTKKNLTTSFMIITAVQKHFTLPRPVSPVQQLGRCLAQFYRLFLAFMPPSEVAFKIALLMA